MATQRALDEADIRRRIDRLANAIRAMDLDAVMSAYAPDIVSFDLEAPLCYAGAETKGKHWLAAFAAYQPPLAYEVHNLTLALGDDLAFGHSLNRVSGTLKGGRRSDFWVRWTACFRKTGGNWLIAHDHVSVPVELKGGRAMLDLQP